MTEEPVDDEVTREIEAPGERTAEYPTFTYGAAVEPTADDEDDDWPTRGPARGIRLALPTAGLVAVLLVAGGFWGGASLQKSHGSASSGGAGSGAAAFLSRLRAAAGTTGTTGATTTGGSGTGTGGLGFGGSGFGGSSAAAAGTISVVDGNTLYVLTAEGALVKVTLGSSTTVTRNAKAGATDLRPGDTVVVQGATSRTGNVTASSVAATAPGVSSGGGFGGGRFSSGGSGTGSPSATGG